MKFSAVTVLIGANVLIWVVYKSNMETYLALFALWPLQPIDGEVHFRLWQLVTYSFLHSQEHSSHLLFNMLGLWMFGAEIERYLGPLRLLACYFASVITAAISQLFIPVLVGAPLSDTIGASGGVFGLLLAYAFLFPTRKVVPLIPPIPMPAWLFAAIYAALELVLGVTGTEAGVAHFAHLGGMVGSILVIGQWRWARSRA
jgi:membrane associated rhomboid family serine protease